jgi:DNA-binding beta-propeller fold protein YncE
VAVDALDNVYVADGGSSVIVKLTPPVAGITSAGWTQSVLAGTIGIQNYHEGTGTGAQFVNPRSIVLDGAHTLYVLDAAVNNVRTVDTVTGATALFAGNTAISGLVGLTLFTPGFQDGIGNLAQFNNPMSLAIDPAAGYLFVADTNNAAVRRISIATQKVDTIIGSKAAPKLQIGGSAMSDGLPSNAVCQGIAVNGTSKQLYMAADDGILTAPY